MNQSDDQSLQLDEIISIRPTGDLVPPHSVSGRALTFVVVIMSFLACLTLGAVSVVWNTANDWSNELIREVSIQVRPLDGVDILLEIEKAIEISKNHPGVEDAWVMSESETQELLQPWLGSNFDLKAVPVPRIINVQMSNPELADMNLLGALIDANVEGASLDDHSTWTSRFKSMANVFVFTGLAVLILMLVSMILCVVFATRAAMSGNKDVVSVLYFVGADDNFIVHEFQRHFLVLGLVGGTIGGFLTVPVFFLIDFLVDGPLGGVELEQFSSLFGSTYVDWKAYVGILVVIAIVTVLTSVTSRLAVLSHLRRPS